MDWKLKLLEGTCPLRAPPLRTWTPGDANLPASASFLFLLKNGGKEAHFGENDPCD